MNIIEFAKFKKMAGGGGSATPSQEKTIDITANGTVEVTPDYGYTLSKVTAKVNVDGNVEIFVSTSDVDIFCVTAQGVLTLQEAIALFGGNGNIAIQIVQKLPEKLIVSDANDGVYVYVVESTGVAYASFPGMSEVTAGLMIFNNDGFDRGWTTDINSVTEDGVYCVRKPTAYNVKSVDELPSDARDGSMAIVESDSLVGDWEWKDNESPLDFSMINIDSEHGLNIGIKVAGYDYFQENAFSDVTFSKNDDGDITVSFSGMDIYVDGEWDDAYKTFEFFTDPSEYELNGNSEIDDFKTFIETNCNRLSGGYSLYIRQNGEWVYEREADMSVGGGGETFEYVNLTVYNSTDGHCDITYTNSEGEEVTDICGANEESYLYDVKAGTDVSISGNYSSVDLVLNGGETLIGSYPYNEKIPLPNNVSDTLFLMILG